MSSNETFNQRLSALGCKSYQDYLESDHWTEFRKKYYSKRPRKCFVTGATADIDLHHIDYSHLGKERLKDVVPLRHDVHKLVHYLISEHHVPLDTAHVVMREAYQFVNGTK